jgi:hypothetical protein
MKATSSTQGRPISPSQANFCARGPTLRGSSCCGESGDHEDIFFFYIYFLFFKDLKNKLQFQSFTKIYSSSPTIGWEI